MHYGASIAFGKIQQIATRAHLISVISGGAGVGVTKPIFSVPLFPRFFTFVETLVAYWISRPYLTGVTTAQLRRHLPNMKGIPPN